MAGKDTPKVGKLLPAWDYHEPTPEEAKAVFDAWAASQNARVGPT